MQKVKDKRALANALILTIVGISCLVVILINGFEWRFLICAILAFVLAITSFFLSLKYKGMIKEIQETMDERDLIITMKSCQSTLQILNYFLYAGCIISLISYALLHNSIFLVISITCCGIIIITLLIALIANSYYEKHN